MTPPSVDNSAISKPIELSASLRLGKYLAPVILLLLDYFVIVHALLLTDVIRNQVLMHYLTDLSPYSLPAKYLYFIIPAVYIGFIFYERLYTRRLPFWQNAEYLFKACFFGTVISISVMYFDGTIKEASRIFIASAAVLIFILLAVARFIGKTLLARCGIWQKPVIVIGAGRTGELLANTFANEPTMGYKIAGFIDDNNFLPLLTQYPLIGNFAHAEQAVKASGIEDVIIAAPGLQREKLLAMVYRIQPFVKNITIVPDLFGLPLSNMEVEALFNSRTVMLHIRNNLALRYNRFFKQFLDVAFCIIGIIFIFPLLALLSLAIYVASPGPIIFAHKRVGQNGKTFSCYKFRTMVTNAQEVLAEYLAANPAAKAEWERDFKLKDDPRVTWIGKLLRKTSLDELPQLINVIKGEMSLVGPRPIVAAEVPRYGEHIQDYYLIKPGITGLWQVSGRNDIDYAQRVRMDSWYVRNWSPWLDVVILMKTVKVVFEKKGAY